MQMPRISDLVPLPLVLLLLLPLLHASGGHVCVLSALLDAGASRWACQLPGASLTSTALDLAALGGHMEVSTAAPWLGWTGFAGHVGMSHTCVDRVTLTAPCSPHAS